MGKLLRTKRVIWGLVCAVVTVVAVLSYISGKRYLATVRAVEETVALEQAIDATLSLLKDGETGQRGFLLTGLEVFLEPYQSERQHVAEKLSRLRQSVRDEPVQEARFQTLEHLVAQKNALMEETIRRRRESSVPAAVLLVRGKALMDAIRAVCHRMSEDAQASLLARKEAAESAQRTAAWGVAGAAVIAILLAFSSFVAVQRNTVKLERAAEEISEREEHFRLLTEQGSDLVRLLDLQGKPGYVSPSVERLLGYTVEEFVALPSLSLVHPDELAAARQFLLDVQHGPKPPEVLTYRLRHKSGEYRVFETRWTARRGADGKVTELHTAARDVTERNSAVDQLKVLAERLRDLALRDELTGLYNRRGFSEVAEQARSKAESERRAAALIFIDLNGMKRINDEFGHDAGDAALKDAANVLTAAHSASDVIARLGGDEFVVFSLDFIPSQLDPLRRRLRALADTEVARLGRGYRLSMSTGAAFLEQGSSESLAALLDRADAAMYAQRRRVRRPAGSRSSRLPEALPHRAPAR